MHIRLETRTSEEAILFAIIIKNINFSGFVRTRCCVVLCSVTRTPYYRFDLLLVCVLLEKGMGDRQKYLGAMALAPWLRWNIKSLLI